MKLDNKKTILVGFAFMAISAFWQVYDNIIPLILKYFFEIGDTLSGGKLWNETEAIVAGYLMHNLARDHGGHALYVLRHTALNSYLGLNKSLDFAAYNPTLEDYVMEAILDYRNSRPNDDLPSFRVSAVDDVLEKYTIKFK